MELIGLYNAISIAWGGVNYVNMGLDVQYLYPVMNWQMLLISLGIALAIWLGLFILQGIGIYTIAKKSQCKRCYLAFIPFANLYYLGEILGGCTIFGRRFKKIGLVAMIAQIVAVLLGATYIVSEINLYYTLGAPTLIDNQLVWASAGEARVFYALYSVVDYVQPIVQFVCEIVVFLLVLELLRTCQIRHTMALSLLVLFVPLSRFIVVFAVRNRERMSYEEWQAKQMEELRRRFQMYGQPSADGVNPTPKDTDEPQSGGEPQPPKAEPFSEFGDGPFDEYK